MSRLPSVFRPLILLLAEAGEEPVKRLLIIYENESTLFAVTEVARGLREGFNGRCTDPDRILQRISRFVRFPGSDNLARQAQYLAAKYRDIPLDVVLTAGPGALRFLLDHRKEIAPGIPLAFGGLTESTALPVAARPAQSWAAAMNRRG